MPSKRSPPFKSVEFDPDHHIIGERSTYHDDFGLPQSPCHISIREPPPYSKALNSISTFFKRLRYSKIDETNTPVDIEDNGERISRKHPRIHTSPSKKRGRGPWICVLVLLLFLSLLVNLYFIFDETPDLLLHQHKPKHNPIPHEGFRFRGGGHNHTCYKDHSTFFKPDYKYSNTFSAYDHLWRDLQGKSHGVVYTSLKRADGKVRKATLGMFHQLHCLARLREVIEALQHSSKTTPKIGHDLGEHHGMWPHCFDIFDR